MMLTALTQTTLLAAPDVLTGGRSRAQELLADDPWWLYAGKAAVLLGMLIGMTIVNIWFERRVVARMQHRVGPNRTGPFGILQTLADGAKLMLKESLTPVKVDKVVYLLAPILVAVPAFMVLAVVPFGPEVTIFGERTVLQLADYSVGVLYVIAIASIGIYGIVLAGWSSGSPYPLLGGLRSSAQMISYEVAMGLSFVAVFMYAGSMSTAEIVDAQTGLWFAIALAPSFVIYVISMVGETNRPPFDLPEAEGELVGGFNTEYSSMKFAMFYLAEFINVVNVSAVAATLFLGGWRAPWPISIWEGANSGWFGPVWLLAKVMLLLVGFIWLRASLPRLRYDQFMALGWKILIPASLAWIVAVAAIRTMLNSSDWGRANVFLWVAAAMVALLIVLTVWDRVAAKAAANAAGSRHAAGVGGRQASTTHVFDPMADGYPVPPLPGQHLGDSPPAHSSRALPAGEEVTHG